MSNQTNNKQQQTAANINIQEHHQEGYENIVTHNCLQKNVLNVYFSITPNGEQELFINDNAPHLCAIVIDDNLSTIDASRTILGTILQHKIDTLNIIGNLDFELEAENCSQSFINQFIYDTLAQVHAHHKIKNIITNGQTGVNLAASTSAVRLNIELNILMPKNFMQIQQDGNFISLNTQDIYLNLIKNASDLFSYKVLDKQEIQTILKKQADNQKTPTNRRI